MVETRVEVKGLTEFRRELKRLDDKLPKEIANVNWKVAEYVVLRARAKAEGIGPMWARAAKSMSASRRQRVALIRLGGARYPEAAGAEFGAGQNIGRQTSRGTVRGWNQFKPFRGNGPGAGYFLYPTIREHSDDIFDLYLKEIDKLAKRAFPD